jgi:hypothetical protein
MKKGEKVKRERGKGEKRYPPFPLFPFSPFPSFPILFESILIRLY